MKSKIILIFFIILIVPIISAECNETQIDINTASLEELTEIIYVGEVRAEEIINLRPFDNVDELINVKGIGNWTLDKIKDQGLACVEEETETSSESEEKSNEKTTQQEDESLKENNVDNVEELELNEVEKQNEVSVINLTPKTIKIEENNENTNRTYAIYGFIIFCILLMLLFILRKNRFKNEFN